MRRTSSRRSRRAIKWTGTQHGFGSVDEVIPIGLLERAQEVLYVLREILGLSALKYPLLLWWSLWNDGMNSGCSCKLYPIVCTIKRYLLFFQSPDVIPYQPNRRIFGLSDALATSAAAPSLLACSSICLSRRKKRRPLPNNTQAEECVCYRPLLSISRVLSCWTRDIEVH
jgi:hypothetical protein